MFCINFDKNCGALVLPFSGLSLDIIVEPGKGSHLHLVFTFHFLVIKVLAVFDRLWCNYSSTLTHPFIDFFV